MKMNKLYVTLLAGSLLFTTSACEKYFEPTSSIDEQSALTNAGDVETATIGTYAVLKNAAYVRSGHFLMEYPSDEIAQGQSSGDDLTRAYRYTHLNTSGHPANFWSQAYKVIAAANKIIAYVPDDATPALQQLKGENLYLRAMMHFNLVRIFGRPYTQGNGENPGVPVLSDELSEEQTVGISRSSVKDVYAKVISDLEKGAQLMSVKKSNSFASAEVCYALLSRVYLYKGDNENAIKYANMVINSGRYALLSAGDYAGYGKLTPENNSETIFGIRHTKVEDRGFSSIGSMYFSGDATGAPAAQGVSGWGELYASQKYMDFIRQNPEDARLNFVTPYTINGTLQVNERLTPKVPMYYINKFSLQEGVINLSSPVYIRLAEVYLNRAEANAKLGNTEAALEDVNLLRTRAGLNGAKLQSVAKMAAEGKSVLDVVLEERWLELAFEGHRIYDLFRNGKSMIRNYPGTHALNNADATNTFQEVKPTDDRAIFFIPQAEIDRNKNLTQNP
jgi:tetratricopeptide (TPR) repeat protein